MDCFKQLLSDTPQTIHKASISTSAWNKHFLFAKTNKFGKEFMKSKDKSPKYMRLIKNALYVSDKGFLWAMSTKERCVAERDAKDMKEAAIRVKMMKDYFVTNGLDEYEPDPIEFEEAFGEYVKVGSLLKRDDWEILMQDYMRTKE
jgi:hypothetical protein